MKRILITLVLLTSFWGNIFACINGEKHYLTNGKMLSMDMKHGIVPRGKMYSVYDDDKILKELDSLWKKTDSIEYLSDYGVVLIYQKKYTEAKEIYLKIDKIKPGRYSTASNLGTVYELLGDNANALKWIRKSVQINPAAHDSSEWLHVRILEAKIKGDSFINSKFLLHTDFGKDSMPACKLSKEELLQLQKALFYQLDERLTFIKPKDKMVAQLLFDLGNIALMVSTNINEIHEISEIYAMARHYGYSSPLLDLRMKYWGNYLDRFREKVAKDKKLIDSTKNTVDFTGQTTDSANTTISPETNDMLFYILGVCAGILSIGAFFFFMRKKK